MIFFISTLKALAACLITNAHYVGVYPSDIIANGGLLGDVLFFAISGYCLVNVRESFTKWYTKRLIRVYIPTLLITVIYMVMGEYQITDFASFIWWFIYPTGYHFVSSILILYAVYYFIMSCPKTRTKIPHLMIALVLIFVLYYIIVYDYTYYHIDNVHEPSIRILFMEAMLMGAWFRQNDGKYRNKYSKAVWILVFMLMGIYIDSKMIFSKNAQLGQFQILNWAAILALLYYLFRLFASLDEKLNNLHAAVKRCISFLQQITLEIYLVQTILINKFRNVYVFPLTGLY